MDILLVQYVMSIYYVESILIFCMDTTSWTYRYWRAVQDPAPLTHDKDDVA